MKALKLLSLFLLTSFLIPQILQCRAQTTNPKITHEEYQWNDDMKRLKITTPERGLIFKITISNEGNEPLSIDKLYINVRVESSSRQFWSFFKQLSIDYLYLPQNEKDYRFVKVDFGSYESIIGSYTAKLTYIIGGASYGEGDPIEVYPFDFRVLSEEAFQQEIQQNRGGTIINIPINIEVSLGGVIGVSATIGAVYLLNKRRKKGR
jgi:hypothetical protein